jgi:hypothetical protein
MLDQIAHWAEILGWSMLPVAIPLGTAYMFVFAQHVLPTLTEYGEGGTWPTSERQFEGQIAAYGRICEEKGLSLTRYRFLARGLPLLRIVGACGFVLWTTAFLLQLARQFTRH